jgi:CRP-like cAMP-binding protein
MLRASPDLGDRMMELLARRLRSALTSQAAPGAAAPAVAKYE